MFNLTNKMTDKAMISSLCLTHSTSSEHHCISVVNFKYLHPRGGSNCTKTRPFLGQKHTFPWIFERVFDVEGWNLLGVIKHVLLLVYCEFQVWVSNSGFTRPEKLWHELWESDSDSDPDRPRLRISRQSQRLYPILKRKTESSDWVYLFWCFLPAVSPRPTTSMCFR